MKRVNLMSTFKGFILFKIVVKSFLIFIFENEVNCIYFYCVYFLLLNLCFLHCWCFQVVKNGAQWGRRSPNPLRYARDFLRVSFNLVTYLFSRDVTLIVAPVRKYIHKKNSPLFISHC